MPEEDDNDFDLDLELNLGPETEPALPEPAPPVETKPKPSAEPRPIPVSRIRKRKLESPTPTPTPATTQPAPPSAPPNQAQALTEPSPPPQPERVRVPAPQPVPSELNPSEPIPSEPARDALSSHFPPAPLSQTTTSQPVEAQQTPPPAPAPAQQAPQPQNQENPLPVSRKSLPPQAQAPADPFNQPSPGDPSAAPTRQREPRDQTKRRTRSKAQSSERKAGEESPPRKISLPQKKLLIGVPVVLLALFLGYRIFGGGGSDEPKLNVNEIQKRAHNPTSPIPAPKKEPEPTVAKIPPVDRSNETPDERDERAEATLGNFFGAAKKERLIRYVRQPERVTPLMLDYYSRVPFEPQEFLGLKSGLQAFEAGPGFYAAHADVGSPRSRIMILEDTPKGFRVDWEYYVEYNPMNWSTFIKEAPAAEMDFRVLANLAPSYRHPFTDESRYLGVKLMTLSDTNELMGYAERNSEIGKRLEAFLTDKFEALCILRLQFPSGDNSGAVYIREFVNPHWIFTDEIPGE